MFESKINRGRANGYAPLDSSSKVPLQFLPPIQSTIDTGSFAITGSNIFTGTQIITGSNDNQIAIGQLQFTGPNSFDIRVTGSVTQSSYVSLTSDFTSQVGALINPFTLYSTASIFGNSLIGFPFSEDPIAFIGLQRGENSKIWLFDFSGSANFPGDVNIGYLGVNGETSGSLNVRNGDINLTGSLIVSGTGSFNGPVLMSSSLTVSSTVVNNGTIDALNSDLIIEGGYLILTGSLVPTDLTGSFGDKGGMVVFDNNFLYYCTNDYISGSEDIWKRISLDGVAIDTGSFATTSSLNQFTQSYKDDSGSFDYRISAINVGSASIPAGTVSSSQQITNFGFATTSSIANVDTSSLLTTSSFNQYTSSLVGVVSSSTQITAFGFVSGSYETTGRGIISSSAQLPNGLLSSSAQALSGTEVYSSSAQLPSGLVSSSTQIIQSLPNGTISGSTQITNLGFASTSSVVSTSSFNQYTASLLGVVSSSTQITAFGFVSGSYETTGRGIISSSQQLSGLGYSTTSSLNSLTASFNSFSSSVNSTTNSLNLFTASAATTGGNNIFTGTNVFSGSTYFSGAVIFEETREVIVLDSNFGLGTRNFDYNSGSVFYLNNLTGSGTWNVTNFISSSQRVTAITFVVEQGPTAYSASAYQLGGTGITVKWQNGATPVGAANKTDVFALSVFRSGSVFNVLGSYSTFG